MSNKVTKILDELEGFIRGEIFKIGKEYFPEYYVVKAPHLVASLIQIFHIPTDLMVSRIPECEELKGEVLLDEVFAEWKDICNERLPNEFEMQSEFSQATKYAFEIKPLDVVKQGVPILEKVLEKIKNFTFSQFMSFTKYKNLAAFYVKNNNHIKLTFDKLSFLVSKTIEDNDLSYDVYTFLSEFSNKHIISIISQSVKSFKQGITPKAIFPLIRPEDYETYENIIKGVVREGKHVMEKGEEYLHPEYLEVSKERIIKNLEKYFSDNTEALHLDLEKEIEKLLPQITSDFEEVEVIIRTKLDN